MQTAILCRCCDILRTAKLSLRTFFFCVKVALLSNNYELCMSVDCEVCLMVVVGVACLPNSSRGSHVFASVSGDMCAIIV